MDINMLANEFHKLNPEQAADFLYKIGLQCTDDAMYLQESWQSDTAGKVWAIMGKYLVKASDEVSLYWNKI